MVWKKTCNRFSINTTGVKKILSKTTKTYPKCENCTFYEKREDGRLYQTEAEIGFALRNSPERSLVFGAVLKISGIYFNFNSHHAKLTFRLLSVSYSWRDLVTEQDKICKDFVTFLEKSLPPKSQNFLQEIMIQ